MKELYLGLYLLESFLFWVLEAVMAKLAFNVFGSFYRFKFWSLEIQLLLSGEECFL